MASKKKAKKKTVFVLEDGRRFDVTGETGKYFICGNTQFRKSAGRGQLVTEEITPEPAKETEE